ncbi:lysophospholipase L1-like esterase [Kitasatospora sp. MAA4]|uniref:SGNH/GDSL hydrolase family protein n=1 Tax=Kitasatospora sp. MAA4 TaxID=3035093 RepID=UPI002475CC8D|nr:SGNH/GDSL hydrolase family protein [Kitasatospora sp. MAA4]MDH6131709.1 lysophospholipase L1-like esterase [Kitasatospora sp. MAA4]
MIGRVGTAWWLGAALLLAGCSAGRTAPGLPHPSPKPPTGPYVALGDSYTAGLQLEPAASGGPKGCGRSGVNYPSLVARDLGIAAADFTDVSCSGATTADLTAAQQVAGGANPAQLDALNSRTRLVTLGIGGNDADFTKVVTQCAEQGLPQALLAALDRKEAQGSPCRASYTAADGQDRLTALLDTVGDRLAGVLQEVRRRAPQARVYLVGYPALLPADPAGCRAVLGSAMVPGDLGFIAEKEQQLNTVLADRAKAAGVGFVDTYKPSAGHDMCAGQATRWVEPPFPAAGRAPLHPNAAGQQAMANAVAAAIRG